MVGCLLGLLGLGLAGLVAAQDQPADSLLVAQSVQPESGLLGDVEFTVEVTLTGVAGLCPGVVASRPSDIVLVLDRSSSMNADTDSGVSKLALLQDATLAFLDQVNLASDRVAVVQFNDAADIVQGLTNDRAALETAIAGLFPGGSTAIDSGVLQGMRELELNGSDAATPVLIVFTDGLQDISLFGNPPVERAREARDAGIRVITIGLGEPGEIDPEMLREMASGPGDAYVIDNPADLTQVYTTIAQSVVNQPAPATDVILQHQFNATAFELVAGSVRPATAVVNGNIISLPVAQVLEAPVTLTYRVRPLMGGSNTISQGDIISYNQCGQTPRQITRPAGLPVAVQEPPTATPPPPTPTPVPTATLAPTLTPAPTWTPTPPLPPGEQARQQAMGILCDPAFLNWLFLLLLLLFFIFWLWRLWRAMHETDDPDEDRRGCICRLCRFIPWLLVPLTLLMLWVLLSRLNICPIRESLYFWRIAGSSGNGEIYVTDPQGLRPAEAFEAVNRGQCVGCHAVSSSARRLAAISGSGIGPVVAYGLNGQPIDVPAVEASFVNWSPDGRLLAIADAAGDIQILNVETGQLSPLNGANDPGVFETMPAWSADGTTIAYVRSEGPNDGFMVTGGADIYVVPSGGGTAGPLPGASGDGFNYYPAYSPDGRWLAFTRHTTGSTTYAAPEAEIFLVPAGGGAAQRLAANDGENGIALSNVSNSWPTWSLDGTQLAFTSKRNDPAYDLFLTDIDAAGNSGRADPVEGASEPGVFEHLPFWGLRPEVNLVDVLLSLWPFLLGYLLLALLYWLCRRLCPGQAVIIDRVAPAIAPEPLPPLKIDPLWQVAPTLLVGVGGTGRWVLTHLKKSLSDSGFGRMPDGVRLALLDTSEQETTNAYRDAAGNLIGVNFAGTSLSPDEVLLLGAELSPLIGQTQDTALAGWFPHDAYQRLSPSDRDLAQGTRQRRPMVRAGLISKLREGATAAEPPPDAARLWRFLVQQCGEVIQRRDATTANDLVRVVLVGSLSGGMSGVLGDLAYLLRGAATEALAQGEGGTVHLEGYFTTDGVFRRQVVNEDTLRINTAATARELERFQLTAGLPTSFIYTPDASPLPPEAAHLHQVHSTMLFDEIVLFGGTRPTIETGQSDEPWATTLASMADVLALRLDVAAAAGTTNDRRAGIRRDAQTKQDQRRQAIVAAAGSYTFRLPLVDMLQIVHTRWARRLYQLFLMGDQESAEVSFNPAEAGLPQGPSAMAQEFISGRIQGAPAGLSAAGQLVSGLPVSPRILGRIAQQVDDSAFHAYLSENVGLILNGSQTEAEARLARRAPRLGYATEFTAEVARLLAEAAARAGGMAATAPAGAGLGLMARLRAFLDMGQPTAGDLAAAAARLAAWQVEAQRSHETLVAVRRLMAKDSDEKDASGQPIVPGLYDELNRRQDDAEKRRGQMDQVAARRYLWARPISPDRDPADPKNQQDLIAEWTQAAFAQLGTYLNRFHWQMDPDGAVRLSLITFRGQRQVRLDDRRVETVRLLADELVALAADATRDVAGRVRLATVLPTQLSTRSEQPEAELARRAWQLATPSLAGATTPGTTLADYRPAAVVGIPDHVGREPALRPLGETLAQLERHLSTALDPVNPAIIGVTDATALTLVRSYDLMPLFGLPELVEDWLVYARNAGSNQARLNESPLLATVFRAERRALDYERRLEHPELLNQDFRRLHPLLVYAFQRPTVVEAFALGLATGWITLRDQVVTLQTPGGQAIELPQVMGGYHPLLAALLQGVATWDSQTPAWRQLQLALAQPGAATDNAWRRFIDAVRQVETTTGPAAQIYCSGPERHPMPPGKPYCPRCGQPAAVTPPPPSARQARPFANEPAEIQDLVAVAVLAAQYRLAGPGEWERIVMPSARRAG